MTQSGRIRRISFEKDLNIEYVLIESDREKNSASNGPIFIEFRLGFDRLLGQKPFFRAPRKSPRCLLVLKQSLKKK